jgi:hypothetical protein
MQSLTCYTIYWYRDDRVASAKPISLHEWQRLFISDSCSGK